MTLDGIPVQAVGWSYCLPLLPKYVMFTAHRGMAVYDIITMTFPLVIIITITSFRPL